MGSLSSKARTEAGQASSQASSRPGLASRFLIFFVRVYQKTVSPLWPAFFGPNAGCRFYPTCSHYAIEALATHGPLRGTWLSSLRLLKCTPLHPGGMDPVPSPRRAPACHRA